ncbi:hypothetical protein AOQ84DRAFT_376247 [Glonium stellatum]|uniref:Uncharacterized protein n=1 Tax=Glonium stellatum TaxID=574774 RepID=A0A8E2JTK4_9PEZI|nr:hypothetical protein AOQ84DRAFT_376247 [Glonium stellatum]
MSTHAEDVTNEAEESSHTQTLSPDEPSKDPGREETNSPLRTKQETASISWYEEETEPTNHQENLVQALARMAKTTEPIQTTRSRLRGSQRPSRFRSTFQNAYGVIYDHEGCITSDPTRFLSTSLETESMQTELESTHEWCEVAGLIEDMKDVGVGNVPKWNNSDKLVPWAPSKTPLGLKWIDCKKLWEKNPPKEVRGFHTRLLTSVLNVGFAATRPIELELVLAGW